MYNELISKLREFPKVFWILLTASILFIGYLVWKDYRDSSSYIPVVVHQNTEWFENKRGEIYKASLAAILEARDLKKQYADLYEEYDKLKKAKPLVITQTIVETKIDSVEIPTTLSDDGKTLEWKWNKEFDQNNFVYIEGQSKIDSVMNEATTLMKSLKIGSDLTVDLISNPDYPSTLQVIARSNNPYVSVVKTEGAMIDPLSHPAFKEILKKNKKTWSIGLQGGYGVHYDLNRSQFGHGPYIGIGVTKTLISF